MHLDMEELTDEVMRYVRKTRQKSKICLNIGKKLMFGTYSENKKIPEIKPLGAMPESLDGGCKLSFAYGYYIRYKSKSQYIGAKNARNINISINLGNNVPRI